MEMSEQGSLLCSAQSYLDLVETAEVVEGEGGLDTVFLFTLGSSESGYSLTLFSSNLLNLF